jgi:hypothetical protein
MKNGSTQIAQHKHHHIKIVKKLNQTEKPARREQSQKSEPNGIQRRTEREKKTD